MYQRGRERTDSGMKAIAIVIAASAGARMSTAAKIGAREQVRALMLLPLGPDQMHDGDDREQHGEGEPLVARDLLRPAGQSDTRDRQPDDDELDRRRRAAQPSARLLVGAAHDLEQMVAERERTVSPDRGTKRGFLIPRTSDSSLERVNAASIELRGAQDGVTRNASNTASTFLSAFSRPRSALMSPTSATYQFFAI